MISAAIDLVKQLRNDAAKAWIVDGNDANLIEGFEGLRLKAYLDSAGVPTIGWGNTYYADGKKVKLGDTITRQTADLLLSYKMHEFAAAIKSLVKVPLNDNQGAALLSFQYNTGALAVSTLLKKLNAGDYAGAAAQFPVWNKSRYNGVLKVNPVLTKRRAIEQALFNKPA
ncbi:lysozyme [Mucilaginibacter sp. RCC_168]|uniref:lysozyme n=1 Tax=Mucilaginibacter sp. RCC_168 TaxID=3239221 RepID=UPI003523EFBF